MNSPAGKQKGDGPLGEDCHLSEENGGIIYRE